LKPTARFAKNFGTNFVPLDQYVIDFQECIKFIFNGGFKRPPPPKKRKKDASTV
jgi:hypothetical protein